MAQVVHILTPFLAFSMVYHEIKSTQHVGNHVWTFVLKTWKLFGTLWVMFGLLKLLLNMMLKWYMWFFVASLLALKPCYNNNGHNINWRWWYVFLPNCVQSWCNYVNHEEWVIVVFAIFYACNKNWNPFGLVVTTCHAIFACVIIGSSNIWHCWFMN